jgi:hypothetical protein
MPILGRRLGSCSTRLVSTEVRWRCVQGWFSICSDPGRAAASGVRHCSNTEGDRHTWRVLMLAPYAAGLYWEWARQQNLQAAAPHHRGSRRLWAQSTSQLSWCSP